MKSSPQVYSPVSGTVTEKNVVVEDGPALINQNAEDEGWLFKWVLGNWHWNKMIWRTSSLSKIMVIMIYSQAGLVRGWRGVRVDEHWCLWDLPQGGMRGSLSETHTFAAYETYLTDWNIFSPNTLFHHLKLNLWHPKYVHLFFWSINFRINFWTTIILAKEFSLRENKDQIESETWRINVCCCYYIRSCVSILCGQLY